MAAFGTLLLAGCSSWLWVSEPRREGISGSMVDYLYPDGAIPPAADEAIPRLRLPARVGIAFVPQSGSSCRPVCATALLSEAERSALLERVRAAFEGKDYVERIEIVPESYLRARQGIDGMRQIARIFGADLMALVSWDQVLTSSDTRSSLAYWTLIGAYLIEGTENAVHTFLDTAVFDVQTGKLLFRAHGVDERSVDSTLIDAASRRRQAQRDSLDAAVARMIEGLETEVARFEQRIKEQPETAEVEWTRPRPGADGGSLPPGALAVLLAVALWRRRAANGR